MNDKFLLNVLHRVFVEDPNTFKLFWLKEKEQTLCCSKKEKQKHFNEVNEQLEFVYTKIEEDAAQASSQKVELLNIQNVIYND